MRIAIWHNLPSGGGKRQLYYHAKGLVERGHSIEVWCPPTADLTYLPLNELCPEHVVPFDWRPSARRGRVGRTLAPYRDLTSELDAMDRHCRACGQEINQGGFDLLFAGSCMFLGTSQIGRYVNLPKALYLGEPYRRLYEARPRLPWLALPPPRKRWWSPGYFLPFLKDLIAVQGFRVKAREESMSAQAFDAILVNSLFSRESVLRAYGLDAKVCYLGVDTEAFVDRGLPRDNLVVGIGAFSPRKNVGFVIRAVATLDESRPRLVWIGQKSDPSYPERLCELARSLGVDFEPRVDVSDQELIEVLNRAALMAYAPRLEPFGFAPLEANACGLPVAAVAEGGVRESVIDGVNGLLVQNEVGSMGAAIGRLLADRPYAKRLGERGRDLVAQNWSLRSAIDRLEANLAPMVREPQHREAAVALNP